MSSPFFYNVEVICLHYFFAYLSISLHVHGADTHSGGGYMAAGTLSAMETGEAIVLAGLAVQLLFFGCFVVVSAVFHYRVTKDSKYAILRHNPPPAPPPSRRAAITWESVLWALYAACALILTRSIFRVVEFAQGNDGWIMQREYLLYIFDACLMAMAGIAVWIGFPGAVLYSQRKSRQSDEMGWALESSRS
jgi:hypothetical protein